MLIHCILQKTSNKSTPCALFLTPCNDSEHCANIVEELCCQTNALKRAQISGGPDHGSSTSLCQLAD